MCAPSSHHKNIFPFINRGQPEPQPPSYSVKLLEQLQCLLRKPGAIGLEQRRSLLLAALEADGSKMDKGQPLGSAAGINTVPFTSSWVRTD